MPPLFRELKRRGARILNERFGSIGSSEKRIDIDIDIDADIDAHNDNDEYVTMKSID